ncbi:hypothetical protein [Luteolibacter soli]|uniref:DUF1145 domain-containing protein n=1 Tax=Luteolibacter soli TaxID=3135280 RepID=A0ABU9AVD8_9BACT
MEFAFTSIRVGILVVLLAAFWLLGGFNFPVGDFSYLQKAWTYSVVMLVSGSVCATIVDHWVGNLDRSNLRWLYVVLGVLLIGGGFMYQHVLKERMQIDAKALAVPEESE